MVNWKVYSHLRLGVASLHDPGRHFSNLTKRLSRSSFRLPQSSTFTHISHCYHSERVFQFSQFYGHKHYPTPFLPLPCPNLSPCKIMCGALKSSSPGPLIRCMCLVRFIELGQKLNLGNEGVDFGQHCIVDSQVSIIIPDLKMNYNMINDRFRHIPE